jgi:DnaK suppressor protein
MMTEIELLAMPDDCYMDNKQLVFFENLLLELRTSTQEHIDEARQRIASPPEFNDEADRAQYEEDAAIALRIVDRERKLLPKINQALRRIHDKHYGYCEESGEPIGLKRLLLRPTAEYCAEVKTLKEQKERFYAN